MELNLNIPDFERFTSDQQFVNVVGALERMEDSTGGLSAEETWAMAWQVVEMLKKASRPETTAKRLLTLISSQIEEKTNRSRPKEQVIHSTHCVLFCVNYLLCANDEEPDPNQEIIDNISEELSRMEDIVVLFEAVERVENEEEAKGRKVKGRDVMRSEPAEAKGLMHELKEGDHWIVSQLEALVARGLWLQGHSGDDVMNGLRKALALESPGLNTKEMALSNKLWSILRKRRGQDSEGSLRTTWLNIVGYCVRHGMLDGASPKLCREFYPNAKGDEYKAIDKGKNQNVDGFVKIEPLLDTYLRKVEVKG